MLINTLVASDNQGFPSRCAANNSSILGIFTGQGAQWPQMGAALVRASAHVRKLVAYLDRSLQTLPEADRPRWSVLDELQADGCQSRVAEASISQPLTCAVQLVLIALLETAGLKFQAIVGHSSGEIAAAHAAGFISSHDAIRIAYYRGFHSHLAGTDTGKKGSMLAAGISLEDATSLCALKKFRGRIVVAASNSASSVTLSGDADAIDEAHDVLVEEQKFARLLRVDKAYHSHHMKRSSEPFLKSLDACGIKVDTPSEKAPRWYSSVEPGEIMSASHNLESTYWSENLNNPVLFSQAVEAAIATEGPFDAALEVGPHPALKGPASEVYEQMTSKSIGGYIGCLSRGKNDVGVFSNALGSLWSNGSKMDFDGLHTTLFKDTKNISVIRDLPYYPWDHDRILWSEARSSILRRQQQGHSHALLGQREADGTDDERRWRNLLSIQELPWLADHGLQGQVVFPATGYISLGVEAAMQTAGLRSVQLVEMTDIYVQKAIPIDEKAGAEVVTSLTSIRENGNYMTTTFSCFSTASKDALELTLNATGSIRLTFGLALEDILAPRPHFPHGMQSVNIDHFYNEVTNLGYNYGPTFCGITQLKRKLGSSTGAIVGPANKGTCTTFLFHPGMLDAALQGLLCAFSSPGDNRLWSLHAPSTIEKVTLVPSICGANMNSEVAFDCTATGLDQKDLYGDVEIYQSDSGLKSISIEGVGFIPFSAASETDDKHLFAYERYDVATPDGPLALNKWRATPEQIQKGLDCERVAFYYLRTLREEIDEAEREELSIEWHHEALFDYADHICAIVERHEHAYIKKDWQSDTYDDIRSIMQRYSPSDPDFVLTVATGENLAAAVRRQTTILEHMTKNDRLNKYYQSALGFAELNRLMATVVHQIAYRYPNMNILEIGAGTGGASREIFAKLGTAYKSYTYTDISSGFFEKAKENFAMYGNRMIYNTLDVTQDPCEQGYIEGSYDLVVAANVLHATPDLEVTLRNARTLLRPGGYLVMMEFIDDSCSRLGVVIGGLPGWWVGRETGRRWSPNVSLSEWHDLLLRSGFAGVDTSTPVLDPLVMPAAIIVARAVDEDVRMLRNPIASSPGSFRASTETELVLLGGRQSQTSETINAMMVQLHERYSRITLVTDWETLVVDSTARDLIFVNLSDLDEPFWKTTTNERFEKLKTILLVSSTVLWATWGADRDNADGAQTMGFFRSLRYELPMTQLQIVDFESPQKADPEVLQVCILRLGVTAEWHRKGISDSKLWTTEPEIRIRDDRVLVPRLLPQKEQNSRYNSSKRDIFKEVNMRQAIMTLNLDADDEKYTLREEEEPVRRAKVEGHRRVKVDASLLSSISTPAGKLFFSLGTDMESGERVLCVASTNASYISVPRKWTLTVQSDPVVELQYLTFLSGYLLSRAAIALVPRGSSVVIHEADAGLASMMARQFSDHDCKVLFTTASDHFNRRGWVTIHAHAQMRHIQAALPKDASVYLNLSSLLSATSSDTLGARIAANLPRRCKKYDASILVDHEADVMPEPNDLAIHNLLEAADDFVTGQANGVPDGMPLKIYSIREVISRNIPIDAMSIVQWHSEPTAPVRVEPIHYRRGFFQEDKTYWLIGLAGDLGRSICEFMISKGARHIVLTSRNSTVESSWVEEHKRSGVEIVYMRGDITNKEDIQNCHEMIKQVMPPISGVANGALVLRDRGLVNMDLDTFHENTRPKVEGTIYLDELFPDTSLDFFIAFSSIAATVGYMGQMAYTAANMFMKALIRQRRARGIAGSVIDVSRVFGVGYLERETKTQMAQGREQATRLMNNSGAMVMSEQDLHQLFAEAVIAGRPDSTANPEIISGVETLSSEEAAKVLWAGHPRFGHFVQDVGSSKVLGVTKTDSVPVKVQLETCRDADEMKRVLIGTFDTELFKCNQTDSLFRCIRNKTQKLYDDDRRECERDNAAD
jgi:acyl transferase domain-containing protein/NAD(P)-dependent dehydrogenase (short-subunit alcohol dehydrogenase family)/ubiquinone/menaquinone biosynthesis C-methylase UbiE